MKPNQLAERIADVDYKSARLINPPERVERLPRGVWVPISVAAHLLRCSGQTLRLMIFTRQMKAIQFPVGPILVNIEKYMMEKPEDVPEAD